MASGPAGYSGTPLAKKLGIREGSRVCAKGAPQHYAALLEPLPPGVAFDRSVTASTDVVHLFHTVKAELQRELRALRGSIRPDGMVWVSWPKKAAKVATDITEDTIREVALPLGFVDVKVCAVDETWSGLKLVIRKELR
ncbi:MAG TPA: DUF3052 domain-containing protein [Burkholderiaceae bacterium]